VLPIGREQNIGTNPDHENQNSQDYTLNAMRTMQINDVPRKDEQHGRQDYKAQRILHHSA
jgi:hypothetical protein